MARAGDPAFGAGDLSQLSVQAKSVSEAVRGVESALVELEIENSGALHAEPIEFSYTYRVRGEGTVTARVARVTAPFDGRAGRAVPPGDRSVFPIVVPLDPKVARAAKWSVARASFFENASIVTMPVALGAIEEAEAERTLQGDKVPHSLVNVTNTTPYVVDAIVLARFKRPKKAHTLIQCRLEPEETKAWVVNGIPLDVASNSYFWGSEIESVELVDWSFLRSERNADARALLEQAYTDWIAWTAPFHVVRGRYSFRHDGPAAPGSGRELRSSTGAFVISGESDVVVTPDSGGDEDYRCQLLLLRAFGDMRRKTLEDQLGERAVELHVEGEETVVRARDWSGFGDAEGDEYFTLSDGRIVGRTANPLKSEATRLIPRSVSGGYLIAEERSGSEEFPHTYWYAHEIVGGLWVPVGVHEDNAFSTPESNVHTSVTLSDVRVFPAAEGVVIEKVVPTGELADRVRAAWDKAYRYPDEPVDLSGSFGIENPGTDALWGGHRKLTGRFVLHGFRGSRWDSWEIDVKGKFSEQQQRHLGALVEDRIRMGAWRDFSGRLPFDEAFLGARFSLDGNAIAVENAFCDRLELRDGRIHAVHFGDIVRFYRYTSIGGALVANHVMTGRREMIEIKHKRVKGWVLPTRYEFKHVFRDWGPETLVLKGLQVSPARER